MPPSQRSGNYPSHQDVWEAVQEFTNGEANVEFTLIDIEQVVSKKDFNPNPVRDRIRGSCVNFEKRETYSKGEDSWRVKRGIYRLYNSEKDKVESDRETN